MAKPRNPREPLSEFSDQLSGKGLAAVSLGAARRKKYERIVVCGMGGSGVTGDILANLSRELRIPVPVETHKAYGLPPRAENACLAFVSFSGETEETLSGFRAALRRLPRGSFGTVTSGGTLMRLAKANRIPLVTIPHGNLTPREAVGYNVSALQTLLRSFFPTVPSPRAPRLLAPKRLAQEGKVLGKKLKGKIVLIYTSSDRRALGTLWKMYLTETGKTPAFANVLPEMDHNEIQSFEKNRLPFAALFLEGKETNARMKKRTAVTKDLLKKSGVSIVTAPLRGKTGTEELWNAALLAAWTARAVAEAKHIAPERTHIIDELKKRMAK